MGQKANNKAILPWFLYREKNITEQDWKETYTFLRKIGYDTDKDIHQQFIQKYDRLNTNRDII